jgi:hypothetical protein
MGKGTPVQRLQEEAHRVSYRLQRFAVIGVKPQRRIVGFTPERARRGPC